MQHATSNNEVVFSHAEVKKVLREEAKNAGVIIPYDAHLVFDETHEPVARLRWTTNIR